MKLPTFEELEKSMKKDMKEALSNGRKPDITHMRTPAIVYTSRGCEYGDKTQGGKYERANYLRPVWEEGASEEEIIRESFKRFRAYMRAGVSHGVQILDALERHQALDPELKDIEGMKRAAYAADTDAAPGCPVGASKLPHACGMGASFNMAVTQAVDYGLLPADPGQPWRKVTTTEAETRPLRIEMCIDELKVYYDAEILASCHPSGSLETDWTFETEPSDFHNNTFIVDCQDIILGGGNRVRVRAGAKYRRVW